jgi:hypothetical protein
MFCEDASGVEFAIEEWALDQDGIATDKLISLVIKNVTWPIALKRLLEPHGLTYMFRHGVVMVTTDAGVEEWTTTTVYTVDDILDSSGIDADTLIDLVMTQTSGPWFGVDNVTVSSPFSSALVVRQTQEVHGEIAAMLAQLRLGLPKRKVTPQIDEVVMKAYVWTGRAKNGDELATAIKTFVAPET